MSLLESLKAGKDNLKIVKFPGTDHKVAIRVLSNKEIQEAEFATAQLFKKEGIEYGPAVVEVYEKEKTLRLLHSALRDPEDPSTPFAANVEELRALTTAAEKEALVDEYMNHQEECAPDLDEMSGEEFSELLDKVKKRPEETALNISSIDLLRRLVVSMASHVSSLQKASGSTSS
jgi:hypothetical protein